MSEKEKDKSKKKTKNNDKKVIDNNIEEEEDGNEEDKDENEEDKDENEEDKDEDEEGKSDIILESEDEVNGSLSIEASDIIKEGQLNEEEVVPVEDEIEYDIFPEAVLGEKIEGEEERIEGMEEGEFDRESEQIHVLSELSAENPEEEEEVFVYEPWMEKELFGIIKEPKGEEDIEYEGVSYYPKYELSALEIEEEKEGEEEEEEAGEGEEELTEEEGEEEEQEQELEAEAEPEVKSVEEIQEEEEEEEKEMEEAELYDYEHGYYFPYGKNYEPITLELIKQTIQMLGKIQLCWPKIEISQKRVPKSYYTCTDKEKTLLWYTENFRLQFHLLDKDRKPLLLAPENEYGIQKMICTTIRPTTIRYPEFQNWKGIANFVSDFMVLLSLDKPLALPSVIRSPTLLLLRQEANCFELSILLCSYLIGHRYDAYVVSGYASREFCLQDHSLTICPYKLQQPKVEIKVEEKPKNKYTVRPAPDLTSQYQKEMDRREEAKKEDALKKQLEEEQKIIELLEKPAPDDLMGLRVHSWVLVLPNEVRPEIKKPFFIEPSLGVSYPIKHHEYHGIESVWNNLNYWVNIQDCSHGIKGLSYNLMDTKKWEHLLPGEPLKWRTPDFMSKTESSMITYQEKHLDMPFSWVERLSLNHNQYELRYPQGGRVFYYKKCTLEKYAPYVMSDGLVIKITYYDDYEWSDPLTILQEYVFRKDRMLSVKIDLVNDTCITKYARGREDALKEHETQYSFVNRPKNHIFRFYRRLDCLVELNCKNDGLKEVFENRDDFLVSREAFFIVVEDTRTIGTERRPPGVFRAKKVEKIVEKYGRNLTKKACRDICKRTFLIAEDKIALVFHYEEGRVTARTRIFTKPPITDTGKRLTFTTSMTTGYLPEVRDTRPTQMFLYHQMEEQMACEEKSLYHLRDIEKWSSTLEQTLDWEQINPILRTSIFDKNQNIEENKAFLQMQKEMLELSMREVESDADFLSPFLAVIENPKALEYEDKIRLKLECLNSFKEVAVERANQLQAKFNWGSNLLQRRQKWFEENQDTISNQELKEYFDFVTNLQFNMSLLQTRLKRHQMNTAEKFKELEKWLDNDPRLKLEEETSLGMVRSEESEIQMEEEGEQTSAIQ